ncbi:hypothetical protein KAR91_03990 [Candidatus Pacearchaeota archaeon]|nr:hypothetical protein [Candidatus Pacearchaeota archaeon]
MYPERTIKVPEIKEAFRLIGFELNNIKAIAIFHAMDSLIRASYLMGSEISEQGALDIIINIIRPRLSEKELRQVSEDINNIGKQYPPIDTDGDNL